MTGGPFRVIEGGRGDEPSAGLLVQGAAEIATLAGGLRTGSAQGDIGRLTREDDPVVACWEGRIAAIGPRVEVENALEAEGYQLSRFARLDAAGGSVTPGLVDAHTHAPWVGSRDAEVNAAPITCSAACSRGRCTGGPPLAPSCDPCVAGICAVDPYCCATGWDDTCVEEVRSVCNSLTCPESAGACAHVACTLGGPLAYGCDEPPVSPSCVATVCGVDPYCCNTEWDVVCVNEVTHCGKNCN